MTRVLLIRHARCHETGERLHGRAGGVALDEHGEREADDLASSLAGETLAAIYTSPVQRAVQTATAVAGRHPPLRPVALDAFEELDFGSWTGRRIDSLEGDDEWTAFNTLRSMSGAPDGEHMLQVQARALTALLDLRRRHDGETIAVVSHADVIRAVIASVLGMPLDNVLRLEIAPASVTEVRFHGAWPQLQRMNCTH